MRICAVSLQIVSEATGRSFVLDPGVRGTVTVLAPSEMSEEALYEVFLNVLELNRLTLVQGGRRGSDRADERGAGTGRRGRSPATPGCRSAAMAMKPG